MCWVRAGRRGKAVAVRAIAACDRDLPQAEVGNGAAHDPGVRYAAVHAHQQTWVQAIALVMLFGFFVMGLLAFRIYTDAMPQPERVVAESGEEVFTSQDITAGQQLFLRRGLMQYGSIVGHGGYLGPDYTADYRRRSAEIALADLKGSGVQDPRAALVNSP